MTRFITHFPRLRATFVTLAAIACLGRPADAAPSQTWSVAVHIRYADGTVYEHAFATGLTTDDMTAALRDCARSHAWGHGVSFNCFAVPE